MVDGNSPLPLPEPIERARRLRRGRENSGITNVDPGAETGNLIGLAFDVPGAITNGIEGIGRGLTGLVGKATGKASPEGMTEPGKGGGFGENGDSSGIAPGSITGGIGHAVSAAGEGIGKVAGAAGDGFGFVTANAGSVLSGAGDMLSGAAEVAGTVISAVGDVAGPVASAAGDVAGAAGEVAGAVLGGLGDLDF